MELTNIVNKALPIIFSNEGGYSSVNKDDNGALSIGKIQWHGNRALSLLKKIVKSNTANAKSILGTEFFTEIIKLSNWNKRILTVDEAEKVSKLLSTLQGKKAQDDLMVADVTAYIKTGQSYGLTDPGALIYFADGVNQYGTASKLWKDICYTALKSTGDIEAIYAATVAETQKYIDRRTSVYIKVKILGLNKPSAIVSSKSQTYKVRKGDTLSDIAKTYETTLDKLVKLNHIKDADSIMIGQVLKIN